MAKQVQAIGSLTEILYKCGYEVMLSNFSSVRLVCCSRENAAAAMLFK